MAKIDSETRDEQINNLGLRVQGVSFFNAVRRRRLVGVSLMVDDKLVNYRPEDVVLVYSDTERETRDEAMESIARAAEELVGDAQG